MKASIFRKILSFASAIFIFSACKSVASRTLSAGDMDQTTSDDSTKCIENFIAKYDGTRWTGQCADQTCEVLIGKASDVSSQNPDMFTILLRQGTAAESRSFLKSSPNCQLDGAKLQIDDDGYSLILTENAAGKALISATMGESIKFNGNFAKKDSSPSVTPQVVGSNTSAKCLDDFIAKYDGTKWTGQCADQTCQVGIGKASGVSSENPDMFTILLMQGKSGMSNSFLKSLASCKLDSGGFQINAPGFVFILMETAADTALISTALISTALISTASGHSIKLDGNFSKNK